MEDQLSLLTLFPTRCRDFFEAREKWDLTLEPLEIFSPSGPAAATELHLAPAEFNVTVHGETYHVKVSGSGRKVDVPQTLLHPGQRQTRRSLVEAIQEILARRAGSPDAGTDAKRKRPRPSKPGDVAPDAGSRRQSARHDRCRGQGWCPLLIIEAMKMESQRPVADRRESCRHPGLRRRQREDG